MFVEGTISSQNTIEHSSGAGFVGLGIQVAANVSLVEHGDDFVAGLNRETRLPMATTVPAPSDLGTTSSLFPWRYSPLSMVRSRCYIT